MLMNYCIFHISYMNKLTTALLKSAFAPHTEQYIWYISDGIEQ